MPRSFVGLSVGKRTWGNAPNIRSGDDINAGWFLLLVGGSKRASSSSWSWSCGAAHYTALQGGLGTWIRGDDSEARGATVSCEANVEGRKEGRKAEGWIHSFNHLEVCVFSAWCYLAVRSVGRKCEPLSPITRRRKGKESYLVDPASSHMLVSKIKPCMCKYKLFCTVKLRMAH